MTATALVAATPAELAAYDEEFAVSRLVAQKTAIQKAMASVMKADEHYGKIPGTDKDKPTLLQPGADTLCFLFHLRTEFEEMTAIERDDFVFFKIRCRLFHKRTGEEWGSGIGSANSREKKYQAQTSAKSCPSCKKPSIFKSKEGGWFCWKKKGGCGLNFKDGDKSIEEQAAEVQPMAVWDLHNTILKMALKRAKVSAVLSSTAASDIFTQDLDDLVEVMPAPPAPAPAKPASPAPTAKLAEPPSGPRAAPRAAEPTPEAVDVTPVNIATDTGEAITDRTRLEISEVALNGLKWSLPHAKNWLHKMFEVYDTSQLTEFQGQDAIALLQARLKSEAAYKAKLSLFAQAGRVLETAVEAK